MGQQNVTTPRGEYGFENISVTLVFSNALRHTLAILDSLDYGNNVKRGQMPGTQAAPVANVGASAKPSCKIGGVGREEYDKLRAKQGPGWVDDEVQVIVKYKRGTKPPIVDTVEGWQCIEAPVTGKPGGAMSLGLEGDALKVIENGVDPFAVEE